MTDEQVRMICDAIKSINGGSGSAPMGFEGLTMALCGGNPNESSSVAAGLHDVAEAIRGYTRDSLSVTVGENPVAVAIQQAGETIARAVREKA